jgi:hypothetical protein
MNQITKDFIKKANHFHGLDSDGNPKFIYSPAFNIRTPSQSEKVEIICAKHNEPCYIAPRHHLMWPTGGCTTCRHALAMLKKIQKSKEEWEKAILTTHLFPDGTPKYDYSEFLFTKRNERGKIICLTCKNKNIKCDFYQAPTHHIDRKQKCGKCADIENAVNQSMPLDTFIQKCTLKHKNLYGYDKILKTYESGKSIILIYCKECEVYFPQNAGGHLSGSGCKQCGIKKVALSKMSNTQDFIEKAKTIWEKGELLFDYSKTEYKSARVHLLVRCIPCNKEFPISPNNHLRGKGCPTCNHRTSKGAREWLSYIQETMGIILQTFDSDEKEFKILPTNYDADGYDPITKTIYEYHGDYWHGNPKVYEPNFVNSSTKTTMGDLYLKICKKRDICISFGYKWIEIWESDWNLLKQEIKSSRAL